MREIKFRGKRVDDGEWIYGCLSYVDSRSQKIGSDFGSSFICQVQHSWQKTDSGYNIGWWIQVETKTVGQFTGLHDKNGVEIYEGDIVYGTIKGLFGQGYQNGIVKYGEYGFVIDLKKQSWEPGIGMVGFCSFEDYEVIGNIHEVEEDEI